MKIILFSFLSLVFSFFECYSSSLANKNSEFAYIAEATNNTSLRFIQTIEYSGTIQENLSDIFISIKREATAKGANCFKFNKYTKSKEGHVTLVLDTYQGDSLYLSMNELGYEQNTIYIISDLKLQNRDYFFKHNSVSKTIRSGKYYKIQLDPNKTTEIRTDGLLGKRHNIQWTEHQNVRFFVFDKTSDSTLMIQLQMIPIVLAKKRLFTELDISFGYFLLNCLKEQVD